mmetsp:Transcript_23607/g.32516  ORF Transcript_23607/g.32516 Transcript_23607/m.32516 type:complete len:201 (+) Transcript_23607:966-1568(+)
MMVTRCLMPPSLMSKALASSTGMSFSRHCAAFWIQMGACVALPCEHSAQPFSRMRSISGMTPSLMHIEITSSASRVRAGSVSTFCMQYLSVSAASALAMAEGECRQAARMRNFSRRPSTSALRFLVTTFLASGSSHRLRSVPTTETSRAMELRSFTNISNMRLTKLMAGCGGIGRTSISCVLAISISERQWMSPTQAAFS